MRLNLFCGYNAIEGYENLDERRDQRLPSYANFKLWNVQDGLGEYKNNSVDGITISHGLSYAPQENMRCPRDAWPQLFRECYRVMELGGVMRITEPLMTPDYELVLTWALENAGFRVTPVDHETTTFKDNSLMQNLHRRPNGSPKVAIWLEARK